MDYQQIQHQAEAILITEASTDKKLQALTQILNESEPKFTWTGFYFMNHETQHLHLGPYTGAPTEHEVIPFGKGICGQVAASGLTYVSDDVQAEDNYIACSVDVRSEIVIPIYYREELVAQLDIDSNTPNAFGEEEQKLLQEICKKIEQHCARNMKFEEYFGS